MRQLPQGGWENMVRAGVVPQRPDVRALAYGCEDDGVDGSLHRHHAVDDGGFLAQWSDCPAVSVPNTHTHTHTHRR